MKKAVLAVLLATASTMSVSHYAAAQAAVNLGQGSTEIVLPPAESNAYNAAIAAATPAAKATALEAFLAQYPNTQVKTYALQDLLGAYTQSDPTKIVPTADRLLQADPTNLRGLTMEVYFRKQAADAITDNTQKQAALDDAAGFAQKGLTAFQNPPKGTTPEELNQLKVLAIPTFYSTIANAALNKGDTATAIENFKKEMAAVPLEQTQTPGPILLDEFLLGQAYLQQKPQDLVNCTFYTARAANFAPDQNQVKAQMLKTSQYCYKLFHGKVDGFEAVQQIAAANLNPPAGFHIDPAPSPKDLAHQALEGTDPSQLALDDREFILANGSPEDADKVWQAMKGKSFTIPDAVVIAVNGTQLQVAVSENAQQTKTADVTVQIKPMEAPAEPKAKTVAAQNAYKKAKADFDAYTAATTVGGKVTFSGTYDSYTATPTLMITMSDGEVQTPKAATPARPARPAGGARRPGTRK